MAGEGRRADDSVAETLTVSPWRFEFFQAVRLLEALAHSRGDAGSHAANALVGYDWAPSKELVRFKSVMSRSFPASEITKLTLGSADAPSPAQMQVAFIGLTGPLGVLPEHYLDLLYQQVRNKDHALRDFFDLFNHRTVSLFYRAWEKYRPAVSVERARRAGKGSDPFTHVLECLVGMGTGQQSDRLPFADRNLLAYAGHLAHSPRSALVLQTILADYLGVPVQVEQFVGRWLPLEDAERSRFPGGEVPAGQFNQLGVDTVIGTQVWDQQGKFRLHLGPMSYVQFSRFLPNPEDPTSRFGELVDFVRMYARIDLDFDVNLLLASGEVPVLRLGGSPEFDARLGWNTWLGGGEPLGDRGEALFESGRRSAGV